MSYPAIVVDNLGKRFKRGLERARYKTLRDAIVNVVKAPYRRFKSLRGKGAADEWFWALRGVSFDVQPGEVVGLIGRNGAGKSTLLKILSRITEPTTGEARIRGSVGSLLEVGTGFHGELTGRENIYLNGAILGMKRADIGRRFDEIVAFAEVEQFLDTPVKHYSSGMYVRLGFAVAAHLEPDVLLVDEVLAVGDAAFQKRCMGKLQDVAGAGRTVVFVSHNMNAIQDLCQRTIWIDGGAIAALGPTDTVISQYLATDAPKSSGVADLSHTGLGSAARFTEVSLLDNDARPSARFMIGEPFTVRVGIRSSARMEGVLAGFSILSGEGVNLLTSYSDDASRLRTTLNPGDNILECRVSPNPLLQGRYSITLSLIDHKTWTMLAHIPRAMSFEVSKVVLPGLELSPNRPGHILMSFPWTEVTGKG